MAKDLAPTADGLVVRPSLSKTLVARKAKLKCFHTSVSSLDTIQHKKGRKRQDWKFRNRVGFKAAQLRKVKIFIYNKAIDYLGLRMQYMLVTFARNCYPFQSSASICNQERKGKYQFKLQCFMLSTNPRLKMELVTIVSQVKPLPTQ